MLEVVKQADRYSIRIKKMSVRTLWRSWQLSKVSPTLPGKEEMVVRLRLLGTSSLEEEAVWYAC
jgi:hypothetical protein